MEEHEIVLNGMKYEIVHDKYTGDWVVYSEDDDSVLQTWILTKEGAINYALNSSGLWENNKYQKAPERCV